MSDTSTTEELNIKVRGDETSLDSSFKGNLASVDNFIRGLDQRAQKIATILKKTNQKLGGGFDIGFSPGNRGGAGSPAAAPEIDKQVSAMKRLAAEHRALVITTDQYKAKLREISDTAEKGSNAQLAALGRLRSMEEAEAREAARILQKKERDEKQFTETLEREERKRDAARRRGSALSQVVNTSRFSAPGGEVQPLVGRTAAALGLSGDAAAVGGVVAGAVAAMGMAAFEQAKEAVNQAADLEASLNMLQAQSGATDADLDKLRATARALGGDTTLAATSSNDAAKAMLELSKAGMTVDETLAAVRGTLELASAAQIGEGEAAKITSTLLKAFGLDASEAGRMVDILASAANNSLADINDIALAAQQCASAFAAAGRPPIEMAASLILMHDAGIRASDAGTSLKTMLDRLLAPTGDAKQIMDGLGIKVYDNQGKFIGLRGVIAQFETKLKDATDQQKKQVAQMIFGADAQRAFNIVLDGGVKKYDEATKNAYKLGEANKITQARTEGLKGAVDGLGSAWNTFLEKQGAPALSWLTSMVKGTTKAIDKLGEWIDALNGAKIEHENFLNSTGAASLRSEAKSEREKAKNLALVMQGKANGNKQQAAAAEAMTFAGALPLPPVVKGALLAAQTVVGSPMANRESALADAGLPSNATNEEIRAEMNRLEASAAKKESSLQKMATGAKRKGKPAPKKTDGNGDGGGDAYLQALLDSLNGGRIKGTGGYGSVPSYVDVPDTVSLPERSGKRGYEDKLQDLEDGFAATRAGAADSGTVLDEYGMTVERLQKRLSIAADTIAETKKRIAELTPTVKAQEDAFLKAGTAYKSAAEPLAAKMQRGYKPTEAEKQNIAALRTAYNRAEGKFTPNKQLLDALTGTNRAAGRQQSDDTTTLADAQTRYITAQREGHLKKLKEKLANGGTVSEYEGELKGAMQRILDKGGAGAVNTDDYQGYRQALNASEANRGELDRGIRQATKGETKADRIAALDAEIVDKRNKGAEEVGLQEYYNDQLCKINQKFYADEQRDKTEQFKWEMEAGEKSRAEYREFLDGSLEETRKQFGATSKEVAALNMEILRLDWQGVEEDSRLFKESLDAGEIGIQEYIAGLEKLQSRVSQTSQPFKGLQKDIDDANRKIREGKQRTADDIGNRAGNAVVDIVRGRGTIASVLKDAASEAFDDALRDAIKRNASKLAMKLFGQKDAADKVTEAARIQNAAADKMLEASDKMVKASEKVGTGEAGKAEGTSAATDATDKVAGQVTGAVETATKFASALGAKTQAATGSGLNSLVNGAKSVTGSITGASKEITKVFGKTAGADIGKFASTAGKWLGYAGAAYSVFEVIKGFHAAQERGFQTREGTSRFGNLGTGDHTGYFDTSAYSGSEGLRRLVQRGEANQARGHSVNNDNRVFTFTINGATDPVAVAHAVREELSKFSTQTAIDNAMNGMG